MKLRKSLVALMLVAVFVGVAGAQEKNLTCVMTATDGETPAYHYEKQVMINESAGIAKFETESAASKATFTDTTVVWVFEDSDGRMTSTLSRVTAVLTRHYDGYNRNGMPDYPHSTTTYKCEATQRQF